MSTTAKKKRKIRRLLAASKPTINKAFSLTRLRERCFANIDDLFLALEATGSGGEIGGKTGERYCFLDNGSKVLAVAHLDTVQQVNHFSTAEDVGGDGQWVFCPKLDDRLGVYTLLDLLPLLGVNVDILFTENEEKGASTARDFATKKKYNWIVEFDRTGTDVVTYDYSSKHWDKVLGKWFTVGHGTFSDIAYLEELRAKGFNVGIGYYNEHQRHAYFVVDEYIDQLARFLGFYHSQKDHRYGHKPTPPVYHNYRGEGYWHGALGEQSVRDSYYGNLIKPLAAKPKDNEEIPKDTARGAVERAIEAQHLLYWCQACEQLWDYTMIDEIGDNLVICGTCSTAITEIIG